MNDLTERTCDACGAAASTSRSGADLYRSPIAALAKKWRDAAKSHDQEYAELTLLPGVPAEAFHAHLEASAEYNDQAEELEAAIAAQVEVWDELDGDFDDVNDAFDQVIADLRGEVVRTRKVMGEP